MAARTGRISFADATRNHRESFLVREESDGTLSYYLMQPARTSDGWVSLAEEHRSRVVWDRRELETVNPYATEQELP